jgi:hypothetical protein
MRWKLCAMACAVLASLALAGQASADFAPAPPQSASASGSSNGKNHWYIAKGTRCVSSPQGPILRTSFLMYADGFPTSNVQNFILHARLIPHGATLPGQNWTRSYSTTLSPSLTDSATGHRLFLTTTAKARVDLQYDWDLQVKLQWKRLSRPDWNTTLVVKYDESRCPGYGDDTGSTLPGQATPNVNGG